MGNCKYCGDKAGFLRSKHGMCEVNYREGLRDMRSLASRAAASPEFNQATLYESLSAIAQSSLAGESDIQAAIVGGWNQAVSESLADGVLTHDEETRLREFRDGLALTREDTRASDAKLEGASRDRLMLDARRERRGTSHGLSIRVARGLYYRPSSFRSQAVEWEETAHVDTGLLGVTTKHVYFHGPRKRFRVRYDKIVSFEPYTDGIGIMRDAQTAKPQSFATGDGWFIYNLVTNLARQ